MGLPRALGFVQAAVDAFRGTCLNSKVADAIARGAQRIASSITATSRRACSSRSKTFRKARSGCSWVLGHIRHIGFAKPSPAEWQNAFPTRPGRLLYLRDLDEGLEQMKRVPADDVTMQIAPAQAPGESDIIISVKRSSPFQAAIDVNNSGTAQTGIYQGSLTLAYDNIARANDILNVTLNSPAQKGVVSGNRGNTISYSIPSGYWTFTAQASKYDYAQNVAGFEGSFTLSGTQHHTEVDAAKTVARTSSSTTGVVMRLAADSSRSFVDDTEIDVQHTSASYAELDLTHAGAARRRGATTSPWAMRNGVPLFGTLPDVNAPNAPTNFYTMTVIDASAGLPLHYLGATFVWRPAFHGQATPNEIAASQQFSIGNRYSVRGFDGSSSLIAESGYSFRNDLELALKHGNAIYIGYDTGCVWGPNTQFLVGHSLTGMAVGLRGTGKHVNYDASLGFAISSPIGFTTAEPAAAVDVSFHT